MYVGLYMMMEKIIVSILRYIGGWKIYVILNLKILIIDIIIIYFFFFEVIKFNSDMYGFLMIIVWVCLINLFLYIFFKRW